MLAQRVPAPGGGRALDVGCGTGELAVFLAEQGYAVDAVDFAEGALVRARRERRGAGRIRWLCLDIEQEGTEVLAGDGYEVITLRLVYPFLRDRTRAMRGLGARLRTGGAVVVITPVAANTPEERRNVALDEDEIELLAESWEEVERYDAEGLAVLVLRHPRTAPPAVEKPGRLGPHAVAGACAVVTDAHGRVHPAAVAGRPAVVPPRPAAEAGEPVPEQRAPGAPVSDPVRRSPRAVSRPDRRGDGSRARETA
nr:class I SAM-dependent methyltransferase [Streptomyces albus]